MKLSYFKYTKKELLAAIEFLENNSGEINDYVLTYSYDDELHELPDNSEDMETYSEFLISHCRVELEKNENEIKWIHLASSLGMAGSLKKMTGQNKQAEKLLLDSLLLINSMNLDKKFYVQQSIRLNDIYSRLGHYSKAEEGFLQLIELCTQNKSLHNYLDFIFQHYGKLQFKQNQLKQALENFNKALELRLKKNDSNLIDSTQSAIRACKSRISS